MDGRARGIASARVREIAGVSAVYLIVASVIAWLSYALAGMDGGWLTHDADRFHAMASAMLSGLTPYIDFIDPKPPLLYGFVAVIDGIATPGMLDIPVVTLLNVLSAMLLFHFGRDLYGFVAGFSAGLLFLVSAVAAEGYVLFAEPFAAFFLLLGLYAAIDGKASAAGICTGIAGGFKQYALFGILPLIWLIWLRGDRSFCQLFCGFAAAVVLPFLAVFLLWGPDALAAAAYWTFGVIPAYLSGTMTGVPDYRPDNPLSFLINLTLSIAVVFPTLVFAGGSIVRRGLRSPEEHIFAAYAVIFLTTLLIRQYLHYWMLILPFLALLACREFADRDFRETRQNDLG
ncbi:MAG: hypothetical protein GKC04_02365 [Methanomicrobiales archaeon]|nr:hypothetical protein [Methanomicrobiales archaeon]